jgi:hypothetical protein
MILWERSGQWAAWMRQLYPEVGPHLTEVRSAGDCWRAAATAPGEPVIIEFRADRLSVGLDLALCVSTWGPGPQCVLGVGSRAIRSSVDALREAGVLAAATSPRELPRLWELMARHDARSNK